MKRYVIANWKSHKTRQESKQWLQSVLPELPHHPDQVVAVVAPPFTHLGEVVDLVSLHSNKLAIATQDISPFAAGAYTGAVSVRNLEGYGVEYAIVGHSERRQYFGEDHQSVAQKVAQLLEAEITPVVCVDDEYIQEQAAALGNELCQRVVVAYEELGAIGTGKSESVDHVSTVVAQIRSVFEPLAVLYGGSVDAQNIDQYLLVCDGVLVGSASLDAGEFIEMLQHADITELSE